MVASKGNSFLLTRKTFAGFFVSQEFLLDLKKYQFTLKSEKVNSIARLVQLGIPTVPFPHVLLPKTFEFYLKHRALTTPANDQLRQVFNKIKRAGYNLTIRPSIFAPKIPGFEFIVANSVNLPTFKEVVKAIISGYDQVIKKTAKPEVIEFAHLVQGFYTANKAGVLYSEDGFGNVHIEGVFGEHTKLITRGEIDPDIYIVDKKTGKISHKQIAKKEFTLESSKKGLKKIKLKDDERTKQVFTDQEIRKIFQYALLTEKKFGPQEIECAVLRTGELIFQSARASSVKKETKLKPKTKNIPIFAQESQGKIVFLRKIEEKESLINKIVVTDNLDIDFITRLSLYGKPKGVILIRGSLTAHAVTILRESRIPSILAKDLNVKDKQYAEIKNGGEVILS